MHEHQSVAALMWIWAPRRAPVAHDRAAWLTRHAALINIVARDVLVGDDKRPTSRQFHSNIRRLTHVDTSTLSVAAPPKICGPIPPPHRSLQATPYAATEYSPIIETTRDRCPTTGHLDMWILSF